MANGPVHEYLCKVEGCGSVVELPAGEVPSPADAGECPSGDGHSWRRNWQIAGAWVKW